MTRITRIIFLGLAFWICLVAPSAGDSVALAAGTCTPAGQCCKICDKGQACGNSCISRAFTCHKGPGCSCNASEVCAAIRPTSPVSSAAAAGAGNVQTCSALKCNGAATSDLESALAFRAKQTHRCFDSALALDRTLNGRVSIIVRVSSEGQVCFANVATNEMPGSSVALCVASMFRQSGHFPSPVGGCTEATVPISFVPGERAAARTTTPPDGGADGGGRSTLTSDQVEITVRNNALSVKRMCWEKIGDGKAGTVNVNVAANVAGNRRVSSATATGDDPVVAKCIEEAVRSWQFPLTEGASPVNIPFKFTRQ